MIYELPYLLCPIKLTFFFLLMCCQLQEHWVQEQLEGGGQGAELWWCGAQGEGLGFAQVMCHTQKQGSILHHAP